MKLIKEVISQTKPIKIDDYSSSTTVYVRSNIKETLEFDPIFNTERIIYIYDETQYTHEEWNKIKTDKLEKNEGVIQEQIDITQLAIVEVLNIIDTVSKDKDTLPAVMKLRKLMEKQYSAIVKMYASMIERGLITVDDVKEQYKCDVEEYLKIKSRA